jgi:hypothetical protein
MPFRLRFAKGMCHLDVVTVAPWYASDCRLGLPTGTADWDCRLGLPTGTADWDCRLRLPTQTADSDCRLRLPTQTAD